MTFTQVPLRGRWLVLGALAIIAFILAACSGSETATPAPAAPPGPAPTPAPTQAPTPTPSKKLVFMAGFKPQANLPFVSVYVAQAKHFYAQEGLDVDIRHAVSGEHLRLLLSGDVAFTTADASSVLRRRADADVPIRAITLFGQKGQGAFAVLERSNIRSVKDWEGKTVGYRISPAPEYLALVKQGGADRSKIREVQVGFDPRILSEGRVDVLPVFKNNEPFVLQGIGHPTRLFDASDLGVPTLGLTIITTTDLTTRDPDLVERFTKATLKGLEYTRDHPDEALDITMRFATQENREHMRFMLESELRDARSPLTDRSGLGWMTEEQWKTLYDQFIAFKALSKPIDFHTAYDTRFLEKAYKDGKLQFP